MTGKSTVIGKHLRIWAIDPLEKAFQNLTAPRHAPRAVQLEAARGEVVSAQIALRCDGFQYKHGGGVNGFGIDQVIVSPLVASGKKGSTDNIPVEARWVGSTYVPVAAYGVVEDNLEGKAPDFYPDPLYALPSAALINGRTQALWLTVRVPRNIRPGQYAGEVQLRIAVFGDILRVPVRLAVYPVTLPALPTCGVENWLNIGNIARQHECEMFSDRFWTLLSAYLYNMADHRQTHILVPVNSLIRFLPAPQGDLHLDWRAFDRFVEISLKAGLLCLSGSHLGNYTYGDPWFACGVTTYRNARGSVREETHEGRTPEAQRWLAWFLPRLRNHLAAKGWLQRWWQHIRDEPGGDMLKDYTAVRTAVERYAPEFTTIDAVHGPVIDACNCWVPALDGWHRQIDFFRKRQALGDQVWTYVCCGQQGSYANRFIDQKSIFPRLLFWIMARHGATGYLHYGHNQSEWPVPELDTTKFLPACGPVQSGDAIVVYPGPNGPRDSIRWELQREGLQDFELFRQLADSSPERAKAILSKVVLDFDHYETGTANFRSARQALLRALSDRAVGSAPRQVASSRSWPVCKPIYMPPDRPRALTPFVQEMLVSRLLPSAGRLDKLAYPAHLKRLALAKRTFNQEFCDLHKELGRHSPDDVCVFFSCRIKCPERMRLAACLGYDGPVKLWIDGREAFHDPDGKNPARRNTATKVLFAASSGTHDILVALGSNHGKAWGIFLRFERLDVPKRSLSGVAEIPLPHVIAG